MSSQLPTRGQTDTPLTRAHYIEIVGAQARSLAASRGSRSALKGVLQGGSRDFAVKVLTSGGVGVILGRSEDRGGTSWYSEDV